LWKRVVMCFEFAASLVIQREALPEPKLPIPAQATLPASIQLITRCLTMKPEGR
jgi:hypothetical protein